MNNTSSCIFYIRLLLEKYQQNTLQALGINEFGQPGNELSLIREYYDTRLNDVIWDRMLHNI